MSRKGQLSASAFSEVGVHERLLLGGAARLPPQRLRRPVLLAPRGRGRGALSTYLQPSAVPTHRVGLWLHTARSSCPRNLDIQSRLPKSRGDQMHVTPLNTVKFIQGMDTSFHHSAPPFPPPDVARRPWREREREEEHQPQRAALSAPCSSHGQCPCQRPDDRPPLALLALSKAATCKNLGSCLHPTCSAPGADGGGGSVSSLGQRSAAWRDPDARA